MRLLPRSLSRLSPWFLRASAGPGFSSWRPGARATHPALYLGLGAVGLACGWAPAWASSREGRPPLSTAASGAPAVIPAPLEGLTDMALPPSLAATLRAARIPAEAVSVLVLRTDGGAVRLSLHADQPRLAASVMKLFTTGAALRTLGPTYVWRTEVALGGQLAPSGVLEGPLYLKGGGDPGLVIEKLQLMMSRWRGAGLNEIRGDIVVDRSAFLLPDHDPAAFDGQPRKPYNAGPDAALLNYQSVTLRLRPDVARPGWARVSLEPALAGVQLDAQVALKTTSGACGDWREALVLKMGRQPLNGPDSRTPDATRDALPDWVIQLRGVYATACGEREWPLLWTGEGPGDYTARLLEATWRQSGGKLGGRVRGGDWPASAVPWATWTSAPLSEVIRDINKYSNNVMARQLFLTLGGLDVGQASLSRAQEQVGRQVREATQDAPSGHSPCDGKSLTLDNGSGLSRTERSSAACLGRWLLGWWAHPLMPELFASLPVAGLDGTARRLPSASGRAHVKTGSLDGVAAVAGIVEGESGQRHVVVGIVNHSRAEASRPFLDALLGWVAQDRSP